MKIFPIKEIARGDTSNNYSISMPCHLGTHIDAPKHFNDSGRPIASFSPDDLVFLRPRMIEMEIQAGQLIGRKELERFKPSLSEADLFLIRTGFQRYRTGDPSKYMTQNPGVSKEAAEYLATFQQLRAIGFDFISLSSVMHREEGRAAHRALLTLPRDFFIIEDMDLASYPARTRRVIVAPLFVEGVDSAPCTVLAES